MLPTAVLGKALRAKNCSKSAQLVDGDFIRSCCRVIEHNVSMQSVELRTDADNRPVLIMQSLA